MRERGLVKSGPLIEIASSGSGSDCIRTAAAADAGTLDMVENTGGDPRLGNFLTGEWGK